MYHRYLKVLCVSFLLSFFFPRTSCLWRDVRWREEAIFMKRYSDGPISRVPWLRRTCPDWQLWLQRHINHKPCLMFYVESMLAINSAFTPKVKHSSCFNHDRPPTSTFLIKKKVVGVNNKPNDTKNWIFMYLYSQSQI